MPSPPTTTSAPASGRAAPKLRDSCQACASSKVKCTKEKPKCSRCTKRGLACEYLATKRAGRTSYKKQAAAAAAKQFAEHNKSGAHAIDNPFLVAGPPATTSSDKWFTLNAFAAAHDTLSTASSRPFSSLNPALASDGSPSLFGDVPGNMDHVLSSSSLNELSKFDEYLDFSASPTAMSPSSIGSHLPDSSFFPSMNNMEGMDFCSEPRRPSSYDPSRVPGLDDAYAGLSGNCFSLIDPSLGRSSRSNSTSTSTAISSPQLPCRTLAGSGDHFQSYTSCLPRALDLLKQLTPGPNAPCSLSGRPLDMNCHDNASRPTIQTVIAQNRQTIDDVRSILECPCSSDDSLTMVLTLVICKVFGWYAAAARVSVPSSRSSSIASSSSSSGSQSPIEQLAHEPVVVGNYCLDGEDSPYMAGQLVLSELHRVQRIVNMLSMRLTGPSAFPCSEANELRKDGVLDSKYSEAFSMSLFSAPLLHHLERDLRKGLKRLSLDIVRELEREFVD